MTAPASRPSNARLFLLIGAGVFGGSVLLLIVSKLDSTSVRQEKPRITGAADVLKPGALSESERLANSDKFSRAQLEDGAWVQVADETGKLSQQYSARSLKPLPEGELALELPKAMLFQKDGRVIVLSANSGRARVPKQALESGTLTGDVKIRIFRPVQEGGSTRAVNVETDTPVIKIDAADAHFDNLEVSCRGAIHLESDMGSFDGEGLSMILDEKGGEIKSLIIDRCTKPIVFVRGADGRTRPAGAASEPAPRTPAPANGAANPPRTADAHPATSGPAGGKAPASAAQRAEAHRFFRLELEDKVNVTRQIGESTTTLRGDTLSVIFAMEGDGGFAHVVDAGGLTAPAGPRFAAASPRAAIAASVLAAQNAAENAAAATAAGETITITYAGRLILRPAAVPLKSADDIEVELRCDPGSAVQIDDSRSRAHVDCDHVAFRSAEDLVEAFGTESKPLTVTSPRLQASGQAFHLRQTAGTGGFDGPGTVRLASGGESFAAILFDPATALVSRDADGAVFVQAMTAAATPASGPAPSTVDIRWATKLDLVFAKQANGAGDAGALSSATFVGSVTASGEAFSLDAADLTAHFGSGERTSGAGDMAAGQLERIVASGNERGPAVARRADGRGSLTAQSLDLTLRPSPAGGAVPATLRAERDVEARDPGQTLWTSTLTVQFLDAATKAPAAADQTSRIAAEIASVEGRGTAQALLHGGGSDGKQGVPVRIYADALDGDGVGRALTVSGEDVWVVRDAIVADRMKSIRFEEATRVATAAGVGRVRAFAASVAPATEGRAERPALPERHALNVEWKDGFRFDERDGDGGAIELHGSVTGRSTPDRSATDAVDATSLRLLLDPAATAGPSAGATDAARSGVRRIVATGSAESPAVFASRRWANEKRESDPRLMQLEGPHIEYDIRTREGFVVGAGKLLAHVPDAASDRPAAVPAERAPDANETSLAGRSIGMGSTGTTRFTWRTRLDLQRLDPAAPSRFHVTMQDGVQMVHADRPGVDAPMVLNAAKLEADFVRVDGEQGTAAPGADGVDLTGTAKLLAVQASGDATARVQLDTGDYRIDCDLFRYDVVSEIATLTAAAGQSVVIVGIDQPSRRTAESVEWNLRTGTIRIRNARGS